jgi:INO80 complex subunit Ies4
MVTLKLSPKLLARFAPVPIIKEESESKAPSSTTSNTLPAAISSPGENASESNSNTPAPSATDSAAAMLPPVDAVKKPVTAGVKRSAATADGLLKPRGKPGPKKKVKL